MTFNWTAPTDNLSGVATIVLQVGTTPGGNDIFDGTVTGTSAQVVGSNGQTRFARLIVTDNAGNQAITANSDGIMLILPANDARDWTVYE